MLHIQYEGNIARIDLRERILKGEHPKQEILEFVKSAKPGTIIEMHLPHPAQPLANVLQSMGYPTISHQLSLDHYKMMCVISG